MARRPRILGLIAALAVLALAPAAYARPCDKCEQEETGSGGGGPAGGGGSSPATVRVTGTFRYLDTDTDPATGQARRRPIAFAKVEIWRFAPHVGPVWTWARDATTTTDANGSISVSMPFDTSGIVYSLRVTATNYAAVVWPNDAVHTVPFHQEPGEPDGAHIRRTAAFPGDTLDFSYDFTDGWTPQHFNIAETVRHGYDYVSARRDPRETDELPPVGVQPSSVTPTGTWYNAPFDTIVISSGDAFQDLIILHEYGHWVEEQISSLPWNPVAHDGCTATDTLGNVVNSSGHAWMEGFADYLAQAVDTSTPGATLTGTGSVSFTPPKPSLESPPTCPKLPAEFTPDEQEIIVAASLWDVFDAPGDNVTPSAPVPPSEPADGLSRHHVFGGTPVDTLMIQILDRELDMAVNIGGPMPTIFDFRAAWSARGLPLGALDDILNANGISTTSAAPADPIPEEGPTDRVCEAKSWTEGCE